MKDQTGKLALTGILGALALALSFLEGLLPPLPMTPPGFKLGLSNIAVMYAAGSLGLPSALFLAALKAGFAFLGRGAAAGCMSLAGGLCATLCVWALWKNQRVSLMAVGVWGALCHNLGQLCAARLLTSSAVWAYLPFLLLFGAAAGLLTGTALKLTLPPLERLARALSVGRSGKPEP